MNPCKLQGGARTDLRAKISHKIRNVFRSKLARAAKPFDWNNDPAMIDARLSKIGPIKIKDQHQSYSCSGQAGAYWVGIVYAVLHNLPYTEISARSIYAPIRYPYGGGATDGDLQNQIANVGALEEAILSSYYPDGTTDEALFLDTSFETPPNMILETKYGGWVKVSVDNTPEAIAEAIRDNVAVLWHIDSHFDGGAPEFWLSNYPRYAGQSDEGHFMCAHRAYLSNSVPTIQALQSFGTEVPNGVQNFDSNNYLGTPRMVDIFTFVTKFVPHPTNPGQMIPNPAIISWQQRLVNFFLSLFSQQ